MTSNGLPVFDLRLVRTNRLKHEEPFALVLGVSNSGQVFELEFGSREEMRHLRNVLLVALRSDRGPLESLGSILAHFVHDTNFAEHLRIT